MSLKYLPALDGLRAFSVFLVVLFHWPLPLLNLRIGWIGVNIFFVLSGFLITRILLNLKQEPFKKYLIKFYKNRAFRIFPLYYTYIGVVLFLLLIVPFLVPDLIPEKFEIRNLDVIKFDVLYLGTFIYNFAEVLRFMEAQPNSPLYSFFGHFWSLAVEEQYYLIFPFVVYWIPIRILKWIFLLIIIITPALRLITGELFRDSQFETLAGFGLTKLPFFYLDAFAIGGILHFLPANRSRLAGIALAIYLIVGVAIGLITVAALNQYKIFIGWDSLGFDHPLFQYGQQTASLWLNLRYAFTFTIVNIGAGLLIMVLTGNNWLSSVMSNQILTYLGRISYGIYIFHLFLLVILNTYILKMGYTITRIVELLLFIAFCLILVAISGLSYRYFESYFLRLKHRP